MKKELKILVSRTFSTDICKKNKSCLFIYGDNQLHVGEGGTACIRKERNALGISTKKLPSNDKEAFYTDDEYEDNIKVFEEDIARIEAYAEEIEATSLVFPHKGIGTGLALLYVKAPRTFFYMCTRLYDLYKYNNLEGILELKN